MCPAVVTPAGRGTAGMRGSVRQGRGGRRQYALAVNSSEGKGAITLKEIEKIKVENQKARKYKKRSEIRDKIM